MGLGNVPQYTMRGPDAAPTSTAIGIDYTFEDVNKKENTKDTEKSDHFLQHCQCRHRDRLLSCFEFLLKSVPISMTKLKRIYKNIGMQEHNSTSLCSIKNSIIDSPVQLPAISPPAPYYGAQRDHSLPLFLVHKDAPPTHRTFWHALWRCKADCAATTCGAE
jgi:hypothetical protein